MTASTFIILFVLGSCFGSFGGVLLQRLENFSARGLRDVVFGRSRCDHTGKTLRWFELIPVVSYLLQWGKSRHTGEKISRYYLWLEIGSGLVFVSTFFLTHTHELHILVYHIVFNRLLFLLACYDMRYQFLHTPVRGIALIWQVLMWIVDIQHSLIASIVFGSIFALIRLFARWYAKKLYQESEGFGSGDVLLALVLWATVPEIFTLYGVPFSAQTLASVVIWFLCISSILWLVYAGGWYIYTRKKIVFIPFLPAMIVAYWILLYQWDMLLRLVFGS